MMYVCTILQACVRMTCTAVKSATQHAGLQSSAALGWSADHAGAIARPDVLFYDPGAQMRSLGPQHDEPAMRVFRSRSVRMKYPALLSSGALIGCETLFSAGAASYPERAHRSLYSVDESTTAQTH